MPIQTLAFTDDWRPPADSFKEIVRTGEAFEAMVRRLDASPALIFDFETSGVRWFDRSRACGIALGCWDEFGQVRSWYVPFRHLSGEPQFDIQIIGGALKRLLGNPRTLKIAHNIKFDDHFARCEGWKVAGPRYDTMVAARLFDENRLIGLKERAESDLGRKDAGFWERKLSSYVSLLARSMGIKKKAYMRDYGYAQVPIDMLGHYACYDIQDTGNLAQFYESHGLSRMHPRLWPTEMQLTEVLCDVEQAGLPIDVEYLELLRDSLLVHLQALSAKVNTLLGRPIELSRDDELRALLYDQMHLPVRRYTSSAGSTTPSVDYDTIIHFKDVSPLIPLIIEWREAQKLATTYTSSILDHLDARHVLHGDLQQVGTDTGRLSCKDPNLQNFPADDDDRAVRYSGKGLKDGGIDPWSIKRAFTVPKGMVRLFFDYSQIELRVMAYYSRDPIMVEAYRTGQDIHDRTSLEVFGSKESKYRRNAKVINFGLCYGLTAEGFARQVNIPVEEAERHFQTFFKRYSGIDTFRNRFWSYIASQGGTFQNLFGRYRRLPHILRYGSEGNHARRQAIASLIQGTAAELTKESMVRIYVFLRSEGIPAEIVTTIHDEIQIDTPIEYLTRVAPVVKREMERYAEFDPIPIVVDGSYSVTNWAEKKHLPLN